MMSTVSLVLVTQILVNEITVVRAWYNCTEEQPNQNCYIVCNGLDECEQTPKTFTCPDNYDCILSGIN